jgi:hypothetical protein
MPIASAQNGIYTPGETQPSGGLAGGFLGNAAWLMTERGATTTRTLKHGAYTANNKFLMMTGWKHTTEEMSNFSVRGKGMFGWNWRKRAWGNPVSQKMLGLKGPGIMGTPWAPSSWFTASRMLDDTSFGSEVLLNIARGNDPYAVTAGVRGGSSQFFTGTQYSNATIPGINPSNPLSAAGRTEVLNSFLGIGTATSANVIRDFTLGSMFKSTAEIIPGAAGKTAGTFVSKGLMSSLYTKSTTLRAGASIAREGAEVLGGNTSTMIATRGLFGVAGAALKAYNWGYLAYQGGKALYKGWEAYAIKSPLAAYKAVGAQLTRPGFVSGDAALLSGVPASNRMRAVQAIQGSRMNARNALGSEASLLSGHFG